MAVNFSQGNLYTQKPTGWQNFGEGVLTNIKVSVPILSGHTVGDYFSNQQETKENLTGTQDGKEAGFIKKTANGFWKKFVYTLPIIGTYQLGKNKIEHENLKNQIEAAKNGEEYTPEKKGFFKTLFTGVGEKIKNVIPFYGTYYRGRMMNENENMYKDSQIIAMQKSFCEEA